MLYTPSPATSPKFSNRPRPPPMKHPHQTPKLGRVGRWYLPLMGVIAMGFGITNYIQTQKQKRLDEIFQEEQRLKRNKELMDAYGDKTSLKDVEHALEMYEVQ